VWREFGQHVNVTGFGHVEMNAAAAANMIDTGRLKGDAELRDLSSSTYSLTPLLSLLPFINVRIAQPNRGRNL